MDEERVAPEGAERQMDAVSVTANASQADEASPQRGNAERPDADRKPNDDK